MTRKLRMLAAPGMLALTLALLAAPIEAGTGKITVTYSLLQEQGGVAVATSLLEGFESGAGLRVRLRPTKESYVYLVVQRGPDDFRLLYPDRRTQRGRNRLEKGKDFIWPQVGWLRFDNNSGSDRIYLIVSAEQIIELEARFALQQTAFPESVILDIRDRYQGDSAYRRKVTDERVKVRFKSRDGEPALLIEEILIRHM